MSRQNYIEAEIIHIDQGTTERMVVAVDQTQERSGTGKLIKKSQRHEVDDRSGAGSWVSPRFNINSALDMMETNVWHKRCVKLKANLTVGLGWKLINSDDPEMKYDTKAKEIEAWLRRPNGRYTETFTGICLKTMTDYFAGGNAYLEVTRQMKGSPNELWHVRSQHMRRDADIKAGGYWQILRTKKVHFASFGDKNRKPDETEIIHHYDYDVKDDYYGIPSWYPALADMVMDRQTVQYMINTYRNQLLAKFAIIVRGAKLSPAAKKNIREFLQKNATGLDNAGATLLLDIDDPNVTITIEKLDKDSSGKDGEQHIKARADARDHIIAAHGVLPRMLGVMSAGSLGGAGEVMGQLKTNYEVEFLPEQERFEELLNNTLMPLFGDHNWKIDFNELDTNDIEKLAGAIEKLVGKPVMFENEAREMLGLHKANPDDFTDIEGQGETNFLTKLRKRLETIERSEGL